MTPPSARTQPEKFEVRGRIEHETAAAVLMRVERVVLGTKVTQKLWFPLSQVHSLHRTYTTLGHDSIYVAYWLAKSKGLTE